MDKTLKDFAGDLAGSIEQTFRDNYGLNVEATPHPVMKTNVEKQGITCRFEDSQIAPTVYADEAFQKINSGEVSLPEVIKEMCDSIYQASLKAPELPTLTLEEAKKHVTLTLVNTKQNEQLLSNTPNFEILGGELSAIPRWYISEEASFVVSNDLCSQMQLTPDEVLQIGQQHINAQTYDVKSMREILSEMMGGVFLPDTGEPQMMVITSDNKIQGSNSLLSEKTLEQVHDMLGSEYVILPSSIHEVICVPITDDLKAEELRAMVQEINMGQVAPEERLSDQIFKFDGEKLSLVGESLKMDALRAEDLNVVLQSVGIAM